MEEITIRELFEKASGQKHDDAFFKARGVNPDDKVKAMIGTDPGKKGTSLLIWGLDVSYKDLRTAFEQPMQEKYNFVQMGSKGEEVMAEFSFHPQAVPDFIATTKMEPALDYVKEDDDQCYFKIPLLFDAMDGAIIIMNQKMNLGLVRIRYLRSLDFDTEVMPLVTWNVLRLLEKEAKE